MRVRVGARVRVRVRVGSGLSSPGARGTRLIMALRAWLGFGVGVGME